MKKLIAILGLSLMLIPALAQNHTDYQLPETPQRAEYIDFPSLDKGFWFAAQLAPAAAFATDGSRATFVQADIVLGYRFGEFFKIGAGVAPRLVIPINSNTSMGFPPARISAGERSGIDIPIIIDLRGNIISQESRMCVPYWNVDAGYTIGQGIYASPTLGIRIGQPRNNFVAGLTYMFQYYGGARAIPAHAFGIRLGFEY